MIYKISFSACLFRVIAVFVLGNRRIAQYERLLNEQRHYSPIAVKEAGTYYVVKTGFIRGDSPYAVGQTISGDEYENLSSEEQNYIETLTFTEAQKDNTYYYCREGYTIAATTAGGKSVTDINNSTNPYSAGAAVPKGIVITKDNYIVTVSLNNPTILQDFANNRVRDFRTAKKTRFLIQIINAAAAQYIKVLDNIYRQMQLAEDSLKKHTKNENLIEMLSIEKTLVYFIASLKENDVVLERLSKGIVLPLFDDDADMLEDAIIENRQAIDMATIYRDILSSISETYGTVINNNLNYAMKFLAGATIVLSIPTIISSFMGMNVPFGSIGTNDHSAAVLLLGSILASLLVALWLRKKGLL